MAIQRTRRELRDTCGCWIEYTWDDTEPEETRKHHPAAGQANPECQAHRLALGPHDLCWMLWDEDKARVEAANG